MKGLRITKIIKEIKLKVSEAELEGKNVFKENHSQNI